MSFFKKKNGPSKELINATDQVCEYLVQPYMFMYASIQGVQIASANLLAMVPGFTTEDKEYVLKRLTPYQAKGLWEIQTIMENVLMVVNKYQPTIQAVPNVKMDQTERLILALANENESISVPAADALGRIKDPCALEPLKKAMDEIGKSKLRLAAVDALANFDTPQADDILGKAYIKEIMNPLRSEELSKKLTMLMIERGARKKVQEEAQALARMLPRTYAEQWERFRQSPEVQIIFKGLPPNRYMKKVEALFLQRKVKISQKNDPRGYTLEIKANAEVSYHHYSYGSQTKNLATGAKVSGKITYKLYGAGEYSKDFEGHRDPPGTIIPFDGGSTGYEDSELVQYFAYEDSKFMDILEQMMMDIYGG